MDIRAFFFRNRSYTPIPLILAVIILSEANWMSYITGIFIAVIGEIIRFVSVAHAGSATRTTAGAGGSELIMTGPYAHVRNPLYLGNFLMAAGLCIAAWPWMPWMLLITTLLFFIQYSLIINLEEEYLIRTFREDYRKYKQHVPRVIPRFSGYTSGQVRIPSFKKAFHSEKSTLSSFILVSVLILLRWQIWG